MAPQILTIALAVLASTASVTSFSPVRISLGNHQRQSIGPLRDFIAGEAENFVESFDINEGGVGLAKRSAIKVTGVSPKGKACEAQDLVRYTGVTELDAASAKSVLEKTGSAIVCSGTGHEIYQDPGSSTRYQDKVIKFSPIEAVKDALKSVSESSLGGATSVVVNFLGGDDLITGEVVEACGMLVDSLDVPEKAKVTFNSMCFTDFPMEFCYVTVVAIGGESAGFEGAEKSVAKGELYVQDGKWWTVSDEDITTATN